MARHPNIDDSAIEIATKVFPHNSDRLRREELSVLLMRFAGEIKRSAIEP